MSIRDKLRCKLLEPIDMYGKPISFRINGSDKVKTTYGGALSLLTYFFYIGIFIYNIKSILEKEPQVTLYTQVRKMEEKETIKLNEFKHVVNFAKFTGDRFDEQKIKLIQFTPLGYLSIFNGESNKIIGN
jgi:hypothetical protein